MTRPATDTPAEPLTTPDDFLVTAVNIGAVSVIVNNDWHPGLTFHFLAAGDPPMQLPPITLILDRNDLRTLRHTIGTAIDQALRTTRRHP